MGVRSPKLNTVVVGWGPLFRKSPKILMKWEPIFCRCGDFVPASLVVGQFWLNVAYKVDKVLGNAICSKGFHLHSQILFHSLNSLGYT